jgi:hypothetical protein
MNDTRHIKTYIIVTKDKEYYCGKTTNVINRLNEHMLEKSPHWFGMKDRKNISVIWVIDGDFEKKIKSFGVKNFISSIINFKSYFMKDGRCLVS